jgi:hypothetical protein
MALMGTRAAFYSSAKHVLASSGWPPVASEVKSLAETDLSCLLGLRALGLQHGVILAKILAGVDRICSLSCFEVPSHGISLYSSIVFVDYLCRLFGTLSYSSFWRLKIVSYFSTLPIAFKALSGSESLNEYMDESFIFIMTM